MNSPMFFMLQIDFPQALPPPLSTSSPKHPKEHPEEEPMVVDEPSSSRQVVHLEGHNQRLPRCQHHHLMIAQVHTVPHHPH